MQPSTFDCFRHPEPPGSVVHALIDCVQTGLIVLDREGGIIAANPPAKHLLGFDPAAADQAGLLGCKQLDRQQSGRLVRFAGGELSADAEFVLLQGARVRLSRRITADGLVLLSVDAGGTPTPPPLQLDQLTGLSDRSGFQACLQTLCSMPGARVAVLMIDLDRFKAINDTMGHPAGDALLKLVGQRLRGALRHADVVSRIGGDEFGVVMASVEHAEAAAKRVIDIISRPYLVERQSAVIGASVGIAYGPLHGDDPASLVRAADLALYQAKADGRGNVRVFDQTLDQRARTRHALADDLRRAIPLQQLELHFQPQINLADGKLTGFEALVRWRHPERGMVSPDQFIPLAEETGVILALGEWVLREACQFAATLPNDLRVAVNVSPKQLLDRERLPRLVATTLAQTGLASHRLEIEVTESTLMREAEAFDVLTAVRAMGVRVSMDDFGTGYSSLSQLRRFPFDKIKIDRSFVADLGVTVEAAAVVRAIAALGKSLGMTTVAEGVETLDQEAICRDDGCTEMQGFLVSKPLPASEIAAFIKALPTIVVARF